MTRVRHRLLAVLAALALVALPLAPLSATAATASSATVRATPADAGLAPGMPTWWSKALKLAQAQKQSTGKGVVIALFDQAIDPNVPELRGTHLVLKHNCDFQGYRYGNAKPSPIGPGSAHGTAMATLLIGNGHGTGPGGTGVRGIAPGATVWFYQLSGDTSDGLPQPYCSSYYESQLMKNAAEQGADIIVTSVGNGEPMGQGAFRTLRRLGVPVVAAAGQRNDKPFDAFGFDFPGGTAGTVPVYAVNSAATPWSGNPPGLNVYNRKFPQNYEQPVISAPGVDMQTGNYVAGKGWVSGAKTTGTSNAAPLVAGALALLKAKYPQATGNQLIQDMIHNTGGTAGYHWNKYYGFGIFSLSRMLAQDPTGWPDVNPLWGMSRKAALKRFPMSSYQQPAANASPGASASPAASGSAAPATANARSDAGTSVSSGSGWVWPTVGGLAAVVVIGVVAAVVVARRRRSVLTHQGGV